MWAAGSAESIAFSTDSGRQWQTVHADPGGALLLSFGFVNSNFGFAAGTGGRVLFTQDGGKTWAARQMGSETILQAAFGDGQHGIMRTRSALLATTDGGVSWKPLAPADDPNWSDRFPYTENLAALDGQHLIAQVGEGPFGDGEFLVTTDGGSTWKAVYLPNGAGGPNLITAGGQYWSIGHEVVEKDKPGGGYATPMAVISSDGLTWEHKPVNHDVCHWHDCGGCTPQGCFGGGSSFVPFSLILEHPAAAGASYARFPAHLLSAQWATTGNTLCVLTYGTIECTALQPAASLDTKEDLATWDASPFPPLHQVVRGFPDQSLERALPSGLRCIRCSLNRMLISQKDDSGPVPVNFAFYVGASGRAEKIEIGSGIPEDVTTQLRQQMNGWLFEPVIENGKPVEMRVSLQGTVFVMNPHKPPHSGD